MSCVAMYSYDDYSHGDEVMDYAVGPSHSRPDLLVLHRADCPQVRAQAAKGEPVMTLYGCLGDPDKDMPRCKCLEAPER